MRRENGKNEQKNEQKNQIRDGKMEKRKWEKQKWKCKNPPNGIKIGFNAIL